MPTLTIVSHTEHYKKPDGSIVGLGPTVTEINHLLGIFETITHVAMLHETEPPDSALPYKSDAVTFVEIPALGGPRIKDKLFILKNIPKTLMIIHDAIKPSDYFQFRAPTGIGVFVLPYLIFFKSKKGWFKYAGNWQQKNAPLAYKIQRWLLMHQKQPVTINGQWENQPNHCLTFENPCLTDQEMLDGERVTVLKEKAIGKINICFVGRLEKAKGLDMFIEALDALSPAEKEQIEAVHVVGDGKRKHDYANQAMQTNIPFNFLGLLSRDQVHSVYKVSHAIVLPSASEGFPKVISEAMNYGCLPIVSNVSSMGQYIDNGKNGFLIDDVSKMNVKSSLVKFLTLSNDDFRKMVLINTYNSQKFTYSHYNNRIKNEIIS